MSGNAEDKGISHWDPPPPRVTAFVAAGAFILASLIFVALDQLTMGAGFAFAAVLAGLFNLGQTCSVNLRVDVSRLNRQVDANRAAAATPAPAAAAEKGGGGILPDPPPPRLLKMVALKSATTSFALAGAVAALSEACDPLLYLALALVAAVAALALELRK